MEDEVRYTLEDNLEYVLVDKVFYNSKEYLLLSEVDNYENICIRELRDDGLYTFDEEDFSKILQLFVDKNKDLFE